MSDTLFDIELPDTTRTHSTLCRCPSCLAHRPTQTPTVGQAEAALDAKAEWHGRARAYVKSLTRGTLITSEDVTDVIGLPTGTVARNRNNAVGALMQSLARKHLLSKQGYTQSRNPQAHGAVIALWRVN